MNIERIANIFGLGALVPVQSTIENGTITAKVAQNTQEDSITALETVNVEPENTASQTTTDLKESLAVKDGIATDETIEKSVASTLAELPIPTPGIPLDVIKARIMKLPQNDQLIPIEELIKILTASRKNSEVKEVKVEEKAETKDVEKEVAVETKAKTVSEEKAETKTTKPDTGKAQSKPVVVRPRLYNAAKAYTDNIDKTTYVVGTVSKAAFSCVKAFFGTFIDFKKDGFRGTIQKFSGWALGFNNYGEAVTVFTKKRKNEIEFSQKIGKACGKVLQGVGKGYTTYTYVEGTMLNIADKGNLTPSRAFAQVVNEGAYKLGETGTKLTYHAAVALKDVAVAAYNNPETTGQITRFAISSAWVGTGLYFAGKQAIQAYDAQSISQKIIPTIKTIGWLGVTALVPTIVYTDQLLDI